MDLLAIVRLCEGWTLTEASIDGYLDEAAEEFRNGNIPLPLYLARTTSLLQNFYHNNASIRANRALHDVRRLLDERDLRSEAAGLAEFWYFIEAIDIRLDTSIAPDVELFPRFVNEMITLSTDVANGPSMRSLEVHGFGRYPTSSWTTLRRCASRQGWMGTAIVASILIYSNAFRSACMGVLSPTVGSIPLRTQGKHTKRQCQAVAQEDRFLL